MEGENKGISYRLQWLSNILKHGLFWHGVRNNFARIGMDFMPYYWVEEATAPIIPPQIRGESENFEISFFGETEINYVKNTIKGIEDKDLLADLRSGQICVGLKHNDTIAAYMFIQPNSFYFRKRFFDIKPGQSYLHSMYTFEAYRGKNIAPYLRYHSYRLLEEKGIMTYYSVSEYFNKSTIRFKKKLNAKPIHLFLSVQFFKKVTWNFRLKTYNF